MYKSDISFGEFSFLRGHWLDRLPAIDEDISFMGDQFEKAGHQLIPGQATTAGQSTTAGQPTTAGQSTTAGQGQGSSSLVTAIAECLARPARRSATCHHTPPKAFKAPATVDIELTMDKPPQSVSLYYRHVSQAERYKMVPMEADGNRYHASIPGDYTDSPYPIQYYFELKYSPLSATLYPGLDDDRTGQPYFVIRKTL